MPCLRVICDPATPASPSFRIATICDSVNRDFFIGPSDLHPLDDTTGKLVKSVSERRDGREEEAVYRAADHRISEGSGSRGGGEGPLSQARFQRRSVLRLAVEIRGNAGE